ncbi:MAG: galactose-1-phosphate uridylyltransferase [Alphaproteobacteria bacterium]|uniref:Galactose-1-phosphate uridylyltransferase n=1 Tax=Candidatus Nitrobium versatile TaxID=2884831 RepID=A0A953JCH7_9BACT|nr:galactose-1-phosphate uridylyltransferase [Candidatus Nitrobium versatile]
MPELRLNMISREWVIIAKEKGKRPEEFIGSREKKRHPEFVETCPFCPGNEAKTPDERYRIHDGSAWRVRVVLNKFSVLSKEGEKIRSSSGMKRSINGVGSHEVIIEAPAHNLTIATMSLGQVRDILHAYRNRFLEAYRDPRIEHVIIFKNSGAVSGTLIEHPLSQVVGIPITPHQVRDRIEGAMRFFDDTGECVHCRTISDELSDGARILMNTDHFVSFIPYAAVSPFHIWVFPKRHSGSFGAISPEETGDLAVHMKTLLSRIYHGLVNPDFNYVIKSGRPSQAGSEYIHWYLTIIPRVAMTSGFELGSGMFINPLVPEVSADFLRNVKIPEYGR